MRRSSQEHQITKANSTAIFGEALASDLDPFQMSPFPAQVEVLSTALRTQGTRSPLRPRGGWDGQ